MKTRKGPTRLGKALVEMAEDQFRAGILDADTFEGITIRHLGEKPVLTAGSEKDACHQEEFRVK